MTLVYSGGTWGGVTGIIDENGVFVAPYMSEWATVSAGQNLSPIPIPVAVLQTQRCAEIDANTAVLLAAGFSDSVSGLTFALDIASQLLWLGLLTLGPAGVLTFPLQITATNGTVYSWATWTALSTTTAQALTAFQTISGGGAALKAQIMAATTTDAVNAIQDLRS